jgi:hypothetical protein
LLLFLNADVFENVSRQIMWQHAKDDYLFVFRQIQNHFGDIGRRPFTKHFSKRGKIPRFDHAPDFRF